MKLLLTGFEPFGGEKRNPSAEIVEGISAQIGDVEIIKLILPVVRGAASSAVQEAVENFGPDVVLSIGQAGGRAAVSVERVAVNLDDYRIPDNGGNQPVDEPIVPGGPDGYFCTVPVKEMVEAAQKAGVPTAQSLSAGTFVCNHVMYATLHYLAEKHPETKFGFIHIPYLPEQVAEKPGVASMSLELSAKAVGEMIKIFAR